MDINSEKFKTGDIVWVEMTDGHGEIIDSRYLEKMEIMAHAKLDAEWWELRDARGRKWTAFRDCILTQEEAVAKRLSGSNMRGSVKGSQAGSVRA